MKFREIEKIDVPDLFAVRTATAENALTLEQLEQLGINEDSVSKMLGTSHRGWLCEVDNRIVAFAMGNKENGKMWVIAVLPNYEGRGIGSGLLRLVEDWLWSKGWDEIWLTTDVDTSLRAYGFYKKQGWMDSEIRDGLRYMKKIKMKY
jgi:ribosomal protein S18 acetylase RimI-like enzyme